MAQTYELTNGALEIIDNGGNVVGPVVQVLGCKKLNSNTSDQERYRLLLSDGKHTISFAMFTPNYNDEMGMEAIQMYSIIKLTNYMTNMINVTAKSDTRLVLILALELIARGVEVGDKIGNPTPLKGLGNLNSQASSTMNGAADTSIADQGIISPISSLCPYHNNWLIKARVTYKSSVRTWANARGEGKLFSMDFMDESGDIRCTAFGEMVDKFYDVFEQDKVYFISQVVLKPANKNFTSCLSHYEMVLINESVVRESTNDNGGVPQIKYNFTSIDKIAVMELGTIVDIIAICKATSDLNEFVSKSSNKALKNKDVILVDQSEVAISITIWGSQAEEFDGSGSPVILVKGAKLSEFAGAKHLSLGFSSLIKLNPNIAEAHRLRTWYEIRGHQLDCKNISARGQSGTTWMTFKEIQQQQVTLRDQPRYFQTYGTILIVRSDRATYKACPTPDCQKKVTDMENGMYRCEKCNREYSEYKYRFMITMNVADWSSNQWVTLFTSEAEKILETTAEEVGRTMETDPDSVVKIFDDAQYKQFVFKCRAKMETYNDEERLKIVVVSVDSFNYEDLNSSLMGRIQKHSLVM